MSLTPEWRKRIENFRREIKACICRELGTIEFEGFVTDEQLTPAQASRRAFRPMPEGTKWGAKWQYAWFRATVRVPKEAGGKRVQLNVETGGETLIWVDGVAAGGSWHGDWCGKAGDRTSLARRARAGAAYRVLMETYAGHGVRTSGNGPVAFHRESVPEPPPRQAAVGRSTFSLWNEEVYQLHMDVETLWRVREKLDPDSLRVSKIDDGLRAFTNIFDPELPWEEMIASAARARRALAPLLKCRNGSTAPEFFAFGHAHVDVAWLWPLSHTERKAGITFSNQLALVAEYPEYRFLQSQPHLYTMLAKRYPEIYKRVKEAVRRGAVVPDGGMWVEADTNITGGESLIRQFIHGKRFFKETFGRESEFLWLPDVFGYSAALPQIMRGCGVRYFSTAKIFWNYNGGETFPYNTFTWEGTDGSEVLAHFCNNYNSECHHPAVERAGPEGRHHDKALPLRLGRRRRRSPARPSGIPAPAKGSRGRAQGAYRIPGGILQGPGKARHPGRALRGRALFPGAPGHLHHPGQNQARQPQGRGGPSRGRVLVGRGRLSGQGRVSPGHAPQRLAGRAAQPVP